MPRKVPCPTCREPVELTPDNAHRPFCSRRCQQVDLGYWLGEEYAISEPLMGLEAMSAAERADEAY